MSDIQEESDKKDEEGTAFIKQNAEDNSAAVAGIPVDSKVHSSQSTVHNHVSELVLNSLIDNNRNKKPASEWKKFYGIFFATLAAFLFSLVNCLVKLLTKHHAFSISFWRQLGNVIPSIPLVLGFIYLKQEPVFDEVWPLTSKNNRNAAIGLAGRGILGSTCVILMFYALEFLTIADTATLMYGGPLFTIALGHVFLKEPCGIVQVLTAIWSLLGVCVITRPPLLTGRAGFDSHVLIGTGIMLIVVLFQAIVTILIRKVRKVHFAAMTLIFGIWGLLQSGIVSLSFGVLSVPTTFKDILFTTLLALSAFLGQICVILSLKFEDAGVVSLCRTSSVVFAFILQAIILDVETDIFSFTGAAIIMFGLVVTACRKWVGTLNEQSPTRRKLKFLLK